LITHANNWNLIF